MQRRVTSDVCRWTVNCFLGWLKSNGTEIIEGEKRRIGVGAGERGLVVAILGYDGRKSPFCHSRIMRGHERRSKLRRLNANGGKCCMRNNYD